MTNEEVVTKLTAHEHEIKSLKHRVDEQEEQSKTIQELVISVKEWAINTKNMMEEQQKQGQRLEKLEQQPAEKWNTATKTVITSIVSTIAGGAAAALIMAIAQHL